MDIQLFCLYLDICILHTLQPYSELSSLEYQNKHSVLCFQEQWQIRKAHPTGPFFPQWAYLLIELQTLPPWASCPHQTCLSPRHLQLTHAKQNASLLELLPPTALFMLIAELQLRLSHRALVQNLAIFFCRCSIPDSSVLCKTNKIK